MITNGTRNRRIVLATIISVLILLGGALLEMDLNISSVCIFIVAGLLFALAPFFTED